VKRTVRSLSSATVVALTAVAVRQQQRRSGRQRVRAVACDEDARRLLHLHADGLLTIPEIKQVAYWSRAYEPGALVEALTRVLLADRTVQDRLVAKRSFLVRVSAEIGPHIPGVPRSSLTSPVLTGC
jgi:hypothetical protein